MGDFMRPLDFDQLMTWSLTQYRHEHSILGVPEEHFWRAAEPRRIQDSFGHQLANPVGPAAGPQTQLAGNLLVAYLTGARFFEVKTVQKLDGEDIRTAVAKPCIAAQDEAYNCEWSTELTVQEALDEYIKAYLLIAVWSRELGLDGMDALAFNMSVGYDLEGIKLPKIDQYIESMKDASTTSAWTTGIAWLSQHLDEFEHFNATDLAELSPQVSSSVTLSTLHGCPADEIERIAHYLLTEKNLNTFVKCNPTMLGYDSAREVLDQLGYDYVAFDDTHFREDLQFDAAVDMFHRLSAEADELGLHFGIKLTNTFPVDVKAGELPADEMYMSGRSLAPLSLLLASRLSHAFDGKLPISFSGGIDAGNIAQVLKTGIQPVTVATTLLKPGGVMRFHQLADEALTAMSDYHGIDVAELDALLDSMMNDPRYHKRFREKIGSRKTLSPLPLTDCYKAPCEDGGCPIHQQIPEYLRATAAGRFDDAFKIIALDNTAPTVTGVLCSQQCRAHCTRLDYDTSIHIRQVKLAASDKAQDGFTEAISAPPLGTQAKIAIIGAGPAGVAAAIFARRNGMDVDVFEKLDKPYGIVSHIIPEFRISAEQIDRDFQMAVALGVNFHFGADPNYDLGDLRSRYAAVIIATGAWGRCPSPVQEGYEHLTDALDFLWDAHTDQLNPGKRVAVIGAGDVAMDCVRTAHNDPRVEQAFIVYRRTEPFMPATQHEVDLVREEGITMYQLIAPLSYDGSTLHCEKMVLADKDASGRRSVRGTGEYIDLDADMVIAATGATVQTTRYTANGLQLNDRGRAIIDENNQSNVPGVYVIGDGARGPATIVEAIADAKVAIRAILKEQNLAVDYDVPHPTVHGPASPIRESRGLVITPLNGGAEGSRCLECQDICEICTEVCPNRANLAITVPGFNDPRQIIHIDGLCNECGDCGTFCPHAGRPYKDKITVFWTRQDFDDSTNAGYLPLSEGQYLVRTPAGEVFEYSSAQSSGPGLGDEMSAVLSAVETDYPYLLAPALPVAAQGGAR